MAFYAFNKRIFFSTIFSWNLNIWLKLRVESLSIIIDLQNENSQLINIVLNSSSFNFFLHDNLFQMHILGILDISIIFHFVIYKLNQLEWWIKMKKNDSNLFIINEKIFENEKIVKNINWYNFKQK